jgi:hypothetical protein
MSFNRLALIAVSAGCWLGSGFGVCAQLSTTYTADIRTTPDPSTETTITRLYRSGYFTGATNDASPIGTVVWLVADTAGNGINTHGISGIGLGGVLQPDDVILWFDAVDGAKAGNNVGQLQRLGAGPFSTNFSTVPIYAFLWSFTNASGQISGNTSGAGFTDPRSGDCFGVFRIGVQTPDFQSGITTATWFISQDVYADLFHISLSGPQCVPEPSSLALVGFGFLSCGWFSAGRNKRPRRTSLIDNAAAWDSSP